MTSRQLREHADRVLHLVERYTASLESLPVLPDVAPGDIFSALPAQAPQQPQDWTDILADVERLVLPGLTHWQSPNFFAFFPANTSGPAILGDLLSSSLGVQGMIWQTSPACTEIETRILDQLARAIGLPESFCSTAPHDAGGGGVIQGTASEATLVAMVAARHRARTLRKHNGEHIDPGMYTVYASTQAHSSVVKSAMITGLADDPQDTRRVRLVPVDSNLAMDAGALDRMMTDDVNAGLVPTFVCATVGTTSTGAIDPVGPIATVARKHNAWLHVDAAYAGAAMICPEFRWITGGIEHADSFCFNPHKWLLTTFDLDCLWTRDRKSLVDSLSITPAYLRNAPSESARVIDYRDWQIPLGRRFRSLKLWFVLRHYGLAGLQQHIRSTVALAQHFESLVAADSRFELVGERHFALVCSRLRDDDPDRSNTRTAALAARINADRRIYLTPSNEPEAGGQMIRFSVGNPTTTRTHIDRAWSIVSEMAAAD